MSNTHKQPAVSNDKHEQLFELLGRLLRNEYESGYSRKLPPASGDQVKAAVDEVIDILGRDG